MRKGATIWILLMVLSCPLLAFVGAGAQDDGTGTDGRNGWRAVTLIYNVYDLQNMSLDLNGNYALANAINASETADWNGGNGFAPIGNNSNRFRGTLDGQQFVISGLTINRPDEGYVGLFGCTDLGSKISNLSLYQCNITGKNGTGGLVGYCDGAISFCHGNGSVRGYLHVGGISGFVPGSIRNCTWTGVVNGSYSNVGGIAGRNEGFISNCTSTAIVTGGNCAGCLVGINFNNITNCTSNGSAYGAQQIAGLVGWNSKGTITDCSTNGSANGTWCIGGFMGLNDQGKISNCSSNGSVFNTIDYTGGFAGLNNGGWIFNSTSTGPVTGVGNHTGGFAGEDSGTIMRCVSTGSVIGSWFSVGGFIGQANGRITDCYSTGSVNGSVDQIGGFVGYNGRTITNCYSTGRVLGAGTHRGGFAGLSSSFGCFTSCYYDNLTAGMNGSDGGTRKNTTEMNRFDTFAGWDFENTWAIIEDETYPFLRTVNNSALGIDRGLSIMRKPPTNATEGVLYRYQFLAYYPNVNSPLYWTLRTNASWLALDPVSGVLFGVPEHSTKTLYKVNVTVTDGTGKNASVEFLLNVTMKHVLEWFQVPGDMELIEGQDFQFTVVASDWGPGGNIVYGVGSNPYCGMTIGSSSGFLSWKNATVGKYAIDLSAMNGTRYIYHHFNLTVLGNNCPPQWLFVPVDANISEGGDYRASAKATDADGNDSITYGLSSEPLCGININGSTGEIFWVNAKPGKFVITISASDGHFTIWYSYNMTVAGKNRPPVWSRVPTDTIMTEGEDFHFTVNATDQDAGDWIVYGLVTAPPCGIGIDPSGGVIIWRNTTPGSFSVSIMAYDGHFKIWHLFNLTVRARNLMPSWSKIPQDTVLIVGHDFNFTAVASDGDGDPIVYGLVSEPASNITINPSSGAIFWSNAPVGGYSVNLSAADGHFTIRHHFNISIIPLEPPREHPIVWVAVPGDTEIYKGQEFKSVVWAAHEDIVKSISYSLTSDSESGIAINGTSGSITWANASIGKYALNISATDGVYTIYHKFNLTVSNKAPFILTVSAPDNIQVKFDQSLNFSATASGLEGDRLVCVWMENGSIISTEAAFIRTFQPGDHTVVLLVSAGDFNATRTFNFTVMEAPKPGGTKKGFIGGFEGPMVAAAIVLVLGGYYRKKNGL